MDCHKRDSDPQNLRMVTRVNGEVRQDGNTANQIYRIPAQIAWYSHAGFSQVTWFPAERPRTRLATRAPHLVSAARDRVECEIEA